MSKIGSINTSLSFTGLIAMHYAAQDQQGGLKTNFPGNGRFAKISLYTSELDALYIYYSEILGISIIAKSESSFSIRLGESVLQFFRESGGICPLYHFAVNVPTNKFLKAKEWLNKRTPLLIDSETGNDELYFGSWDAHAVYFKDPAGNIGELISRHSLDNAREGNFGLEDMLCISEIGTPANNPIDLAARLKQSFGLEKYLNSSMFVGDENGLFVIPPTGHTWIPERTIEAAVYNIDIEISDKQIEKFDCPGYPYHVKGV